MRSDAFITVTCDRCGDEEDVQLTAIARGGYDERYVDSQLRQLGWRIDSEDICPDCLEEENSEDETVDISVSALFAHSRPYADGSISVMEGWQDRTYKGDFVTAFYDPKDSAYKMMRCDDGVWTLLSIVKVDPTKRWMVELADGAGHPEMIITEIADGESIATP